MRVEDLRWRKREACEVERERMLKRAHRVREHREARLKKRKYSHCT
uniref:Uncharacterized protein n=1 Tax=Arundo donax TaxID=35708 RepID=A0A0A9BBM0_ARUDO